MRLAWCLLDPTPPNDQCRHCQSALLKSVGKLGCALLQVSNFAKQPAAQRTVAFVPGAPGTFITASNKSGECRPAISRIAVNALIIEPCMGIRHNSQDT